MKYFTLLICALSIAQALLANPVDEAKARKQAEAYLASTSVHRSASRDHASRVGSQGGGLRLVYKCLPDAKPQSRAQNSSTTTPLYYVFDKGTNGGFIVVSGDDGLSPILADTQSGQFNANTSNEGLRWWLNTVKKTVSDVQANKHARFLAPTPKGLKQSVDPIIKTRWDQSDPYYLHCPIDSIQDGEPIAHSLTGCVATAMAQILYHHHAAQAKGTVSYTTKTRQWNITAKLDTIPLDWSNMQLSYGKSSTKEQKKAVARLMYACGVSQHMDYKKDGSGTFPIVSAYVDNFGMDKSIIKLKRDYYTVAEWDSIIKTELSAGRPIFYTGDTDKSAHAFICDGYNTAGLFNINWGWGGTDDGFFALSNLVSSLDAYGNPTTSKQGYNQQQEMIIGIQPNKGTANYPQGTLTYEEIYYGLNTGDREMDGTFQIPVRLYKLTPMSGNYKEQWGLGLFKDGKTLTKQVYNTDVKENYVIGDRSYWKPVTFTIPRDVADGTYVIRPINSVNGQFQYMHYQQGEDNNYAIIVKIKGDEYTLSYSNDVKANLTLLPDYEVVSNGGEAYEDANVTVAFKVRDTGADFYNHICLMRQGSIVSTEYYIVPHDSTLTIKSNFEIPWGVKKDTLQVYTADVFNIPIKLLGEIVITTTKKAYGNPDLTFTVPRSTIIAKGQDAVVEAKMSNSGGWFENWVWLVLYDKNRNQISENYTRASVNKDRTVKVSLKASTSTLPAGKYTYFVIDQTSSFRSNWGTLTITEATGVGSVNYVEKPKDEKIYSLQGVCLGSDWEKLPQGIYIKGGKKVVKQ